MSVELWTPDAGMSQIVFTGKLEFRDMFQPSPSKDEWGVDTLERVVRGPASRYEAFYRALRQGQVCNADIPGANYFFLQTWQPINHPIFPGVAMTYKGLIDNVVPPDTSYTVRNELMSTISADGLSITAGDKTIVSGSNEIKYISPTTIWRYISRGEPTVQKYGAPGSVRGALGIENLGNRIVGNTDEGDTIPYTQGTAPAALATALFGTPYVFVIGPSFTPIIGTPFFECEEICQMKYPDN